MCEGRGVRVATSLARESTSLAFFLGVGWLEAAVKGESYAAKAGLGGGRDGSHEGDVLLKQLWEEAKKTSWQTLHARGGMAGAPEDRPGQGDP